ncbi:Piso0_005024 [Millerozyma farinosa CBS 7064]|uniref:Piso0_005024 protein n=1 Tax=Pichia sorbitophila (strain ATCC MYA-4447 / BCRC 22081 / CBS 7064 / NBRC 10061 / NRRL Y-12695) TaxID=559304 RepID=G8Y410_PICSO|nr:Piso0_005024 [Millerozyma farinosa CBS 7064]
MLQIPPLVKNVFDSFPLRKYGPVVNSSDQLNEDCMCFGQASPNAENKFILAVNQTFEFSINEKVILLPVDPHALACALILCYKNNLTLPRKCIKNKDARCVNSMIKVNYHASPDKMLPMLVENNIKLQTREVRSSESIKRLIQADNSFENDPIAKLINQMLDTEFYDLWILCLLTELLPNNDNEKLRRLFYLDDSPLSNDYTARLITRSIYNVIPCWNNFQVRYSELFHESLGDKFSWKELSKILKVDSPFSHELRTSFSGLYSELLANFKRKYTLIYKYTSNQELTKSKAIVALKFYSFIIIVDQFADGTDLSKTLEDPVREAVIKDAYEAIKKYA